MAGFDMILPLMLDAINKEQISASKTVEMLSEKPATIFGLGNKGYLKPGYDADFVLVNMDEEFVFDKNKSHSKAGEVMHVFDGMKLSGRIKSTWVRGTKVQEEGQTLAAAGYGQFVRPQ